MTYLSFIHYTTGLGDAAIFSRIVGLGVNAGLYWNFTTLGWDTESVNTKVFMTEYTSADTVESLYQANITLPDSTNVYIIEAVLNSTGRVIGSDETTITNIKGKTDTIVWTDILKLLGLCLENSVEDDIVRDGSGNKTSSVIYIYNSNTNATLHDKVTGIVEKYNVSASYTAGKLTLFKVIPV